jgi:hypothetical protein
VFSCFCHKTDCEQRCAKCNVREHYTDRPAGQMPWGQLSRANPAELAETFALSLLGAVLCCAVLCCCCCNTEPGCRYRHLAVSRCCLSPTSRCCCCCWCVCPMVMSTLWQDNLCAEGTQGMQAGAAPKGRAHTGGGGEGHASEQLVGPQAQQQQPHAAR